MSCKDSWISCCKPGARGGAPPSFRSSRASSIRAHPAATCSTNKRTFDDVEAETCYMVQGVLGLQSRNRGHSKRGRLDCLYSKGSCLRTHTSFAEQAQAFMTTTHHKFNRGSCCCGSACGSMWWTSQCGSRVCTRLSPFA